MIQTKKLLIAGLAIGGLLGGYGSPATASQDHQRRPAMSAMQRAATFEVYKDRGGKFRWRLRSSNGQIIATSGEGYAQKAGCLSGIESVKRDAGAAKIEEK